MKILVVQTPHYDFCAASLIEGLNDLEIAGEVDELYCAEASNYGANGLKGSQAVLDHYEAKQYAKDKADVVIVTSNNNVKEDIVDGLADKSKVVYIDGEDVFQYKKNPHDFALYFKRELRKEGMVVHPNVRPFPFAAEKRYFRYKSWFDKKYAVSCMFGPHDETKPWRTDIEKALLAAKLQDSIIGAVYGGAALSNIDTGNRDHSNYYEALALSKMSIDAHGAYECNSGRYWESLANNCCLFTRKNLIDMPYPFIDGEHLIEFETPEELVGKIEFYIDNMHCIEHETYIKNIAKAGYKHLKTYHTTKARSSYLLSECKKAGII